MKYIPLNVKTEYDLMNSLIRIDELISYAKNEELSSVGITDCNMFSSYEFITKCKSNNIKSIIGLPLEIDNNILYLYARNYEGFVSLCKIVSKRNIDGSVDIDFIKEYSNNIILVCNYKDYEKYKNDFEYIYIYYTNDEEKKNALLVSEDVVYLPCIKCFKKDDLVYLKYLKYIEEGKTIEEDINIKEEYLKENANDFDIKTTIKFSSLIDIELPKSTIHIPVYKENSSAFLKALAKKGLEKRLGGNVSDEYKSRLIYELDVIEKMNYVDYFHSL